MVTRGLWGKLGIGHHGNMVAVMVTRERQGQIKGTPDQMSHYMVPYGINASIIIPHTCTCVVVYTAKYLLCTCTCMVK